MRMKKMRKTKLIAVSEEAAVKAVMNAAMSMKPLMRTMRNLRENFAGLHSTSISAM